MAEQDNLVDNDPFNDIQRIQNPSTFNPALRAAVEGNRAIGIDKAIGRDRNVIHDGRSNIIREGQQKIGFAHVREALDEIEKRLQATVLASEEVMRFHARPEPVKEAGGPLQHLPGDNLDATVWEDLATRAVLLSRAIEALDRNMRITLETLR